MKHVGVNVAADSLMSISYIGVEHGLVLVSADDPGAFSSQNEQDNRQYAKFGRFPCLDPSNSEEARQFVKLAFDVSELFTSPVYTADDNPIISLQVRRGSRPNRRARTCPPAPLQARRTTVPCYHPGISPVTTP